MKNVLNGVNVNPTPPPVVNNFNPLQQYGLIGQNKFAGVFYEEFQRELIGRRGVETYKEMSENDDVIGAILFAIEMLMRQVEFKVEPNGKKDIDIKAAEFVEECLHDMSYTWQDTLSEILSFLTYGWSYHEICYKRRMGKSKNPLLKSKYNDGLIGWQKLPIRAQDTLWMWQYDENDEMVGMSQIAMPDMVERTIPLEKALHFRTKSRKNNPEGKSIFRNAYRSWYFKKRMQEIEGIGVERDLAGLPMIIPPEDYDLWDPDDPEMAKYLSYATKLVQNVRRDATEGIVLPHGWTFQLLNGGSRRQFEVGSVIERYDNRMAMTVLADFVLLGHQAVGSFALSSDKTEMFSVAIGAFLKEICDVFNDQAIPRLIELNKDNFGDITDYPKMKHSDIESINLTEISTFIKDMTGIGILAPDENLAEHLRKLANLPEPSANAPMPGKETLEMMNGKEEKKENNKEDIKNEKIEKKLFENY